MTESHNLASRIREYYQVIFMWYKNNGHIIIEKLTKPNQFSNWTDEMVAKYRTAIDGMPYPEKATLEEMVAVAKKVRGGILECNYGERISEDLNLGTLSKQIIELYERIKRDEEFERLKSSVLAIDYNIRDESEYFERANDIYKNVLLESEKHIGGRVALVDTNLEYEKLSSKDGSYKFRKPEFLNFEELPKGSIYDLVMDGHITIQSINVKS